MISLTAPYWLALLALALPITAFHAWRRKTMAVSSVILWRQVAGKYRTRPRFVRPRLTWPLALQLLAMALLAFALAQPHWGPKSPDHAIYLVDTSAAMQSLDGNGNRLDAAKAALVADVADDFLSGAVVSVIAVGPAALPVAVAHSRQSGLVPLLDNITVTDGGSDWPAAFALARTIAGEAARPRLHVITGPDNALGALPFDDVQITRLGPTDTPALALSGMAEPAPPTALRPLPPDGALMRVTGTVTARNTPLPESVSLRFTPYATGDSLDFGTAPLTPVAEGMAGFDTLQSLPEAGMLEVVLPADATPQDNLLAFDTLMPWPARVLLLGAPQAPSVASDGTEIPPDDSIARAITAVFGGVDLAQDLPDAAVQAGYDLIVVNDLTLEARPAGNVLWLNRARLRTEDGPAPAASGTFVSWSAEHPALAHLALNQMDVQRFHPMPTLDGGEVLASVGNRPVISARRGAAGIEMRIALDLQESGWTTGPALVQALLSVADWAAIGPQSTVHCVIGTPCRLPAHLALGEITGPGTRAALAAQGPVPESMGNISPTRAGLYRLADGRPLLVTAPAQPEGQAQPDDIAPETRRIALGPWLLALAAAVLAAEMARAWRQGHRGRLPLTLRIAALVAVALAWWGVPLPRPSSDPDRQMVLPDAAPSLGQAIAIAAAKVQGDLPARVTLAGDGFDASRDAALALPVLTARGIPLDVVLQPAPIAQVPQFTALSAPAQARAGDQIALTLQIDNPADAPATLPLTIASNGAVLVTQDTVLVPGANRIDTAIGSDSAGPLQLTATLGESRAEALVTVGPAPRALIVAQDTDWGSYLAQALALQRIEAEVMPPVRTPQLLDRWLERDLIILADVPAGAFSYAKLEAIESAVRDHGRGLMILGGPNAFGPGGYFATPLEALSPLSAKVPQEAPLASVAFVVDRSGSMLAGTGAGSRLDVARAATISAATTLDPESSTAIVAFDAAAHLMMPLTQGADAALMEAALGEVTPGGGTALIPALEMAVEVLSASDLPLRHIVVMTDGQVEEADFAPVTGYARANGITISTIGIGPKARAETLGTLAEDGGGSYHSARDVRSLPSILAQEAMSLAGDPVENGQVPVYWAGTRRAPLFAGLPQALPPLDAYVQTTLRAGADLHIALRGADDQEVPVMASWRQGAGYVLSFASQGAGGGVGAWMAAPDYPRFWAQIARQMLPDAAPLGLSLTTARRGDLVDLTLTRILPIDGSLAEDTFGPASLTATAPDGTAHTLVLTRSAPYVWRATLPVDQTGLWQMAARQGIRNTATPLLVGDLAKPREVNAAIGGLAQATGGRVTTGDAPAIGRSPTVWQMNPTRSPWAVLALLLVLADLAARYLRATPRPRP